MTTNDTYKYGYIFITQKVQHEMKRMKPLRAINEKEIKEQNHFEKLFEKFVFYIMLKTEIPMTLIYFSRNVDSIVFLLRFAPHSFFSFFFLVEFSFRSLSFGPETLSIFASNN